MEAISEEVTSIDERISTSTPQKNVLDLATDGTTGTDPAVEERKQVGGAETPPGAELLASGSLSDVGSDSGNPAANKSTLGAAGRKTHPNIAAKMAVFEQSSSSLEGKFVAAVRSRGSRSRDASPGSLSSTGSAAHESEGASATSAEATGSGDVALKSPSEAEQTAATGDQGETEDAERSSTVRHDDSPASGTGTRTTPGAESNVGTLDAEAPGPPLENALGSNDPQEGDGSTVKPVVHYGAATAGSSLLLEPKQADVDAPSSQIGGEFGGGQKPDDAGSDLAQILPMHAAPAGDEVGSSEAQPLVSPPDDDKGQAKNRPPPVSTVEFDLSGLSIAEQPRDHTAVPVSPHFCGGPSSSSQQALFLPLGMPLAGSPGGAITLIGGDIPASATFSVEQTTTTTPAPGFLAAQYGASIVRAEDESLAPPGAATLTSTAAPFLASVTSTTTSPPGVTGLAAFAEPDPSTAPEADEGQNVAPSAGQDTATPATSVTELRNATVQAGAVSAIIVEVTRALAETMAAEEENITSSDDDLPIRQRGNNVNDNNRSSTTFRNTSGTAASGAMLPPLTSSTAADGVFLPPLRSTTATREVFSGSGGSAVDAHGSSPNVTNGAAADAIGETEASVQRMDDAATSAAVTAGDSLASVAVHDDENTVRDADITSPPSAMSLLAPGSPTSAVTTREFAIISDQFLGSGTRTTNNRPKSAAALRRLRRTRSAPEQRRSGSSARAEREESQEFERKHETETKLLEAVKSQHIYTIPAAFSILADISLVAVFFTFCVTGINLCRHHTRQNEIADMFHRVSSFAENALDEDVEVGQTETSIKSRKQSESLNRKMVSSTRASSSSKRKKKSSSVSADIKETADQDPEGQQTNKAATSTSSSSSSSSDSSSPSSRGSSATARLSNVSSFTTLSERLEQNRKEEHYLHLALKPHDYSIQVVLLPVIYALLAFKSVLRMSELMSGTMHHDRIHASAVLVWLKFLALLNLEAAPQEGTDSALQLTGANQECTISSALK
ncbi:unnamed protein product [Amoebophrya sp. A25]|nr:unnamed protein product [Amoebophrya sp. A25]|eukprot:GSA25T00018870001.1